MGFRSKHRKELSSSSLKLSVKFCMQNHMCIEQRRNFIWPSMTQKGLGTKTLNCWGNISWSSLIYLTTYHMAQSTVKATVHKRFYTLVNIRKQIQRSNWCVICILFRKISRVPDQATYFVSSLFPNKLHFLKKRNYKNQQTQKIVWWLPEGRGRREGR